MGADGDPAAWWGIFMIVPGAYLAMVAVPFTAAVARCLRDDGLEYWKFKESVLLE